MSLDQVCLWSYSFQLPKPNPKGCLCKTIHQYQLGPAENSFLLPHFGLFNLHFQGFISLIFQLSSVQRCQLGHSTRLLSSKDNLIPLFMTGFNHVGLVLVKKPPPDLQRNSGNHTDNKERDASSVITLPAHAWIAQVCTERNQSKTQLEREPGFLSEVHPYHSQENSQFFAESLYHRHPLQLEKYTWR